MVITRRTLAVVDPRLFGSAVTVNILSIPQQLLERLRQLISAFFHAFSILRQEASCKTCKMGGNSLPCTYHYLVSEFNVCALIPQPENLLNPFDVIFHQLAAGCREHFLGPALVGAQTSRHKPTDLICYDMLLSAWSSFEKMGLKHRMALKAVKRQQSHAVDLKEVWLQVLCPCVATIRSGM